MTTQSARIPFGPAESYNTDDDLLSWMGEQFERFGSIYKASIHGVSVYVVRDPPDVRRVLRDNWQNYKKGQAIKRVALLLGNGLMVSEGELWKTQRQLIQPAFNPRAIDALVATITASNMSLLRKWERAAKEGAKVNVTRDVSSVVLEVVLISIFGADYDQVAQHFDILTKEPVRNLEFAQVFRSLAKLIRPLMAHRREAKTDSSDILGMLMEARDRKTGETMPDQRLVNEIKTIIVAGHETTASTLNWIWYLLARHPEVEQKLSRELEDVVDNRSPAPAGLVGFTYTHQVIDEALRLYPAGWLLTRKALRDDFIGEYFVPAGTEIYISPYFVQRHPDFWEDPDRFNPDRFDADCSKDRESMATIPFSAGPRNCIGERFARIEMQIHLTTIARHLRLNFVEEKKPELDVGVNLRSKHDFFMIPEFKDRGGNDSEHAG